MLRIVADLGNSRLKWGRVGPGGALEATVAQPVDDPGAWAATLDAWDPIGEGSVWAISTVNPPVAERLGRFLRDRGVSRVVWSRSAADVPIDHDLTEPDRAGADRAWAVLAARDLHAPGRPGIVISCGTAITVERVGADGRWKGGAIAPGLALAAKGLHRLTAQLPLVEVREAPPAWGRSTEPALEAGVFWGAVGAVRELIARQSEGLSPHPWLVWTGGDAPTLARWVEGAEARVVPDLVLLGLARAASGGESGRP
jgi:type III pantothenate kinase